MSALLWFAIRREWRALVDRPGIHGRDRGRLVPRGAEAWPDWIDLLLANTGKSGTWAAIPVPLVVRGPIGVALIAWGALRNQRWMVPVGTMLCLPALWYGSLTMLLGVIPLTTPEERAAHGHGCGTPVGHARPRARRPPVCPRRPSLRSVPAVMRL